MKIVNWILDLISERFVRIDDNLFHDLGDDEW